MNPCYLPVVYIEACLLCIEQCVPVVYRVVCVCCVESSVCCVESSVCPLCREWRVSVV